MLEYILAGFTGTFFSYWITFTCGNLCQACTSETLYDEIKNDVKRIKEKLVYTNKII